MHFNCTSSSDGARVERSESTPVVSVPGLSTTGTTNGQSYVSMLPSVSVSTEPDVEFLKVGQIYLRNCFSVLGK